MFFFKIQKPTQLNCIDVYALNPDYALETGIGIAFDSNKSYATIVE